jgi:hypothetical protein
VLVPFNVPEQSSAIIARVTALEPLVVGVSVPFQLRAREFLGLAAGELDVSAGPNVRWTLPAEPGIYQAELVVDYGADGFAFDVLLLELA